jgi:hypothetical protein
MLTVKMTLTGIVSANRSWYLTPTAFWSNYPYGANIGAPCLMMR